MRKHLLEKKRGKLRPYTRGGEEDEGKM